MPSSSPPPPRLLAASTASSDSQVSKALKARGTRKISAAQPAAGLRTVPDVRGYDAPSAIRILERAGLNVNVEGSGRVASQSLPHGSPFRKGQKILLKLRI